MSNRDRSTLMFCERVSELETIKARWRLARNLDKPCPQVVVIKAERGLGKTRLALEFYKWLRENEDGWMTKSYWPDAVDIVDRNLEINPDPGKCKLYDLPIPYLWWGLRAADVGAENGVAADAIATYDQFLAPHLAALFLKSEMLHNGWSLAKAMANVGIDLAASAFNIDKVLSIGKGVFRTAEILLGAANKQGLSEAMDRQFSRSDSVLKDLQREFKPGTPTCAKVPGIILLDDAQFIHDDPALPSFVERLMYHSVDEGWPLLILVTHWRTELSPEVAESTISFARILKHGRDGAATEPGPAAYLPGGYLNVDNLTEIDLKPIPDLSDALREKLPGLTPRQSTAILADLGGNPRFLEQVIAFLREHEALFESLDTSRSLTSEGLEETLKETCHQEIFRIVLRRLRKAPEDVQEAICLASLQGMRFSNDIVDELAQDLLGRSGRGPLSKGEEPYSMLVGTRIDARQSVGQFAERLFHRVAQEQRRSMKSFGGERALQTALKDKLRKVVAESRPSMTDSSEALGVVCRIAVDLLENSALSEERSAAQRAASIVGTLELMNYSLESGAAWYERLLAIKRIEPGDGAISLQDYHQQNAERIKVLEGLVAVYKNLDWPAKQARTLRRLFTEATNFPPGDLYYGFLGALDKQRAADVFSRWKLEFPAVPVWVYEDSVRKIVAALLGLHELARAWPTLKAAKGDQSLEDLGAVPLLIRAEDVNEQVLVKGSAYSMEPREPSEHDAIALEALAYAQDAVLGEGEVAKQHFGLLERSGRQAMDRGRFDEAEDCFQRALKINQELGDDMFQLSTLNNLAGAFANRGDAERATKYLELALPLVNSYINEPTFLVDLIIEDSGPDGHPVIVGRQRVDPEEAQRGSDDERTPLHRIRRVQVPAKFSKEFDVNPDDVLSRDRTMMGVIASVFGNAGHQTLAKKDTLKAKRNFLDALRIHEEIGDPEGAFHDLERLTHIAYVNGEREEVCAHLRRCLTLAPALRQVDPRRWKDIERETRDAMGEAGCS